MIIGLLAGFLLFPGSTIAATEAEQEFSPPPEPALCIVRSDRPSPVMAGDGAIRWLAECEDNGEIGTLIFEHRHPGGKIEAVQSGNSDTWTWSPEMSGEHRVRVVNETETVRRAGSWSEPVEVVPPLTMKSLKVEPMSPQMIGTGPFTWSVSASGGIGDLEYIFEREQVDGEVETVQSGSSMQWRWSPQRPGTWRIRVTVVDAQGHRAESDWSAPYEIVPLLEISTPTTGTESPQMAGTGPFTWSVDMTGGAGEPGVNFELRRIGGETEISQTGQAESWDWTPETPGRYQVRAQVVDRRGNEADSTWSDVFTIVPELNVQAPTPGKPSPQTARSGPVSWTSDATGGVGELSWRFEVEREDEIIGSFISDNLPAWAWQPDEAGTYRVRAVVTDARGNTAASDWSEPYRIEPPLELIALEPDRPAPRMAQGRPITWSAEITGGVGEKTISFALQKDDADWTPVQTGPESEWTWRPSEAGNYRVRVSALDERDNRIESDPVGPFRIEPPLAITGFRPDRSAPQTARTVSIDWSVEATGGVGEKNYTFELARDEETPETVQNGSQSTWTWTPQVAGNYRIGVTVTDAHGNRVARDWSEPYRIKPPLVVRNLSVAAPSPQMNGTGPFTWSVDASGGVGELSYGFEIQSEDGTIVKTQESAASEWPWSPDEAGNYRVRVVASDALGNRAASDWSELFVVAPKLDIESFDVDRPSPQMLGTGPFSWIVTASGGAGDLVHSFEIRTADENSDSARTAQAGESTRWDWQPESPDRYLVRTVVTDSRGNRVASAWSAPYVVAPPLAINSFDVDKTSPQMAGSSPITWRAAATGGAGDLGYIFELQPDEAASRTPQAGASPSWTWRPDEAGRYRVRVIVSDIRDNRFASDWSEPFVIEPSLSIEKISVDRPSPQMLGTGPFTWRVTASGGVGELEYLFELEPNGNEPMSVQAGPDTDWAWNPDRDGTYRVRAVVSDSLDNSLTSSWYGPYEIAPRLAIRVPQPGKPAPQAAQTKPIAWSVDATGGVQPLGYRFELERDDEILETIDSERLPAWTWRPQEEGNYRVRAVATDLRGNEIVSDWSETYRIEPPLVVGQPGFGIPTPQVAGTVEVPWSVEASGGVGEKRFRFELAKDDGTPRQVQADVVKNWNWIPQEAGSFRVRVTMVDALDNRAVSAWSAPFEIEPPLAIRALTTDKKAPQAAQTVPITWNVETTGGVAPITYAFELSRDGRTPRFVQQSYETAWTWRPGEEGDYRVRVVMTDLRGNREEGEWSQSYEIAPPLEIEVPVPDNLAGQYLVKSQVAWDVTASGGVGDRTFSFDLERRSGEVTTFRGRSSGSWTWRPADPGFYRVRGRFADVLGNTAVSGWTGWKEIRTPLAMETLTVSEPSPKPALRQTVLWTAATSGGIGDIEFEFFSDKKGEEMMRQKSSSPSWEWLPRKTGEYRVKVRARDTIGHVVESAWSEPFRITPAVSKQSLIAFLPMENLSGAKVPVDEIDEYFAGLFRDYGMKLLDERRLQDFMRRHRMRYTGGIGSRLAQALRDEEEVDAVIMTSLETFMETGTPQIALTSRLVTCQDTPRIAWIDGVGMTGNDSPGLLALNRIESMDALREKASERLMTSFDDYLSGRWDERSSSRDRLEPSDHYRASDFVSGNPYRIAIVPFLNTYARRNAGFVVPLHLVNALDDYENLEVVEPGLVREQLLKYRLIMQAGPSLAISDILASENTIGADLVLSGYVFDYQDQQEIPKIDFSTRLFDGRDRKIVWWSRSSAAGDDGVFFFDVGRIRSAHTLMQQMSLAISRLIFEE